MYLPADWKRILRAGGFAVTTEIAPPDSADPAEVYERAAMFDGYVDAIQRHRWFRRKLPHVQCRHLLTADAPRVRHGHAGVLPRQKPDSDTGDVLGAAAMGVANILCLTGDGVQSGDHPQAKPVFDLDSMSTLEMLRDMRDNSRFMSGRVITSRRRYSLAPRPTRLPNHSDIRPVRLARKISAGAQFIQTQYCFDINMFSRYMARVRGLGLHEKAYILAGVGPLSSARSAEWIRANVAGVHIPDSLSGG